MKIIKSLQEVKNLPPKSLSLTIGNFDGLHSGHRKLLCEMLELCEKEGKKLIVMTFVPHPLVVLDARRSFLLNSYEERRDLLSEIGVDYLLEETFTRDFSNMSPDLFLEKFILPHEKAIGDIFLGYDFAFGANKSGDFKDVQNFVDGLGVDIKIRSFKGFKNNKSTISSSLIREHLVKGEMKEVTSLLGRPFSVSALVKKGLERGRKIGFPTANLEIDEVRLFPLVGVYASEVEWKGLRYKSVTNIGINPTFNEDENLKLETHILDFDDYIYGEKIKVSILDRIRDEKKFDTVNDLISQIKKDVEKRRTMS